VRKANNKYEIRTTTGDRRIASSQQRGVMRQHYDKRANSQQLNLEILTVLNINWGFIVIGFSLSLPLFVIRT